MTSTFIDELNKNTVEALTRGTAFFMQPHDMTPPIISNSFNGLPINGANYLNLMLANAINGTQHTEYVKMNEALASKPEWFSTLPPENRPRAVVFQEESLSSAPRYSFVMPAAELNQNVYADAPIIARPQANYVPYQSQTAGMNDFGSFIHEQFTNAINASFTNSMFKINVPQNDMEQFKAQLIGEIVKNPRFMAEAADRAYQEVMDSHYLPFNRSNFIEKARDENSHEFRQLNTTISAHVQDMYATGKPSFNRDFNELSKPLLVSIGNIQQNTVEPKPAIDDEIAKFIKEQVKQERAANVLVDTCAGAHIEKVQKAQRIGNFIVKGAALAGALFTNNFPAAAEIGVSIISDIANKPKVAVKEPDQNKIVIDNREYKKNEVEKILNFDNAPFSFTGKDKPGKKDYEMAHKAEKAILAANPSLNKDEYQQDKTHEQALNFVKNTVQKIGGNAVNDVMKVADSIVSAQGLKGDNALKKLRDDPRAFFSGLNQTIKDNPRILEQAVSHVKNITKHPMVDKVMGKIRS